MRKVEQYPRGKTYYQRTNPYKRIQQVRMLQAMTKVLTWDMRYLLVQNGALLKIAQFLFWVNIKINRLINY